MLSLFTEGNTYSHVEGLDTPAIRVSSELLTFEEWASCDPTSSPPPWCFASQEEGSTEQ